MLAIGRASYLRANINSLVALMCVSTVALGAGLIIWHASTGHNPIADFLVDSAMTTQYMQQ